MTEQDMMDLAMEIANSSTLGEESTLLVLCDSNKWQTYKFIFGEFDEEHFDNFIKNN